VAFGHPLGERRQSRRCLRPASPASDSDFRPQRSLREQAAERF